MTPTDEVSGEVLLEEMLTSAKAGDKYAVRALLLLAECKTLQARIEALEKAARAYLNWHRRQKLEPESPADFLNEELKEDELGDALAAALAKEKTDHVY